MAETSLRTLLKHGVARARRSIARSVFKTYKYYGLRDLDQKLEAFVNFDGGTFVECGANDGLYASNTAYFEKHRGWTGLLVEPIPQLYRRCVRNRPKSRVENYALVGRDFTDESIELHTAVPLLQLLPFTMASVEGAQTHHGDAKAHVRAGMSLVQGFFRPETLRVPATTLSALLDRHGMAKVDLLSLDVEGFEYQALTGLDLSRHRPSWMLIECNVAESKRRIDELLAPYYEQRAHPAEHDFLYGLR